MPGPYKTPFELREGKANVFRNKNKRPDRKDPDWRGECLINGVKHSVVMWESRTKANDLYFNVSISVARDAQQPAPQAPRQNFPNDDDAVEF